MNYRKSVFIVITFCFFFVGCIGNSNEKDQYNITGTDFIPKKFFVNSNHRLISVSFDYNQNDFNKNDIAGVNLADEYNNYFHYGNDGDNQNTCLDVFQFFTPLGFNSKMGKLILGKLIINVPKKNHMYKVFFANDYEKHLTFINTLLDTTDTDILFDNKKIILNDELLDNHEFGEEQNSLFSQTYESDENGYIYVFPNLEFDFDLIFDILDLENNKKLKYNDCKPDEDIIDSRIFFINSNNDVTEFINFW